MKHSKNMVVIETAESKKLALFCENEEGIYQRLFYAFKIFERHYRKGDFDKTRAVDYLYPIVSDGAKVYTALFNERCGVTVKYSAAAQILAWNISGIMGGCL